MKVGLTFVSKNLLFYSYLSVSAWKWLTICKAICIELVRDCEWQFSASFNAGTTLIQTLLHLVGCAEGQWLNPFFCLLIGRNLTSRLVYILLGITMESMEEVGYDDPLQPNSAAYNLGDLKREEEILISLYSKVSALEFVMFKFWIYAFLNILLCILLCFWQKFVML